MFPTPARNPGVRNQRRNGFPTPKRAAAKECTVSDSTSTVGAAASVRRQTTYPVRSGSRRSFAPAHQGWYRHLRSLDWNSIRSAESRSSQDPHHTVRDHCEGRPSVPVWRRAASVDLVGCLGCRVGSAEGGLEASWRAGALPSGVSRLVGVDPQAAEVDRSRGRSLRRGSAMVGWTCSTSRRRGRAGRELERGAAARLGSSGAPGSCGPPTHRAAAR